MIPVRAMLHSVQLRKGDLHPYMPMECSRDCGLACSHYPLPPVHQPLQHSWTGALAVLLPRPSQPTALPGTTVSRGVAPNTKAASACLPPEARTSQGSWCCAAGPARLKIALSACGYEAPAAEIELCLQHRVLARYSLLASSAPVALLQPAMTGRGWLLLLAGDGAAGAYAHPSQQVRCLGQCRPGYWHSLLV
jgi:hypothetical protein